MEPTKKNRSLLRPRAVKKRGNPIFVTSQLIPEREPEQIIVNEVIEPEQSSSVKYLIALTNEQDTTPEGISDSIEPPRLRLKRQRMNDDVDNKRDESFIVSLPLIALEKRLDFSSRCDDKCRPGTMAVIGEIYPKEILLSPSPEGGNGRHSIFEAFDTAFNNKWGLGDDFREASHEIENSPLAGEDDKDPDGEKLSEKQLQSESSDTIENGYD